MIHIYNGLSLSYKKDWNSAICSTMHGPRGYCIKWGKSERERYISSDITYLYNIKKKIAIYLQNRNRLTDIENTHIYVYMNHFAVY